MTQGQSAYTLFKERRFGPVLAQSLLISKAVMVRGYPYYHIDLNSGGGYNHEAGVAGSPLNFLWAKDRHQRHNFYAFFCDNDPIAIDELIRRQEILAQPRDRIFIHQADNSEVLPVVSEFVARRERNPHFAMGSILIDPNGYHKGIPWDALRVFCAAHPRFDLFLNLNIRLFRLEAPHITSGEWRAHRLQPISGFAAWFTRPNWMITDLTCIQGSTWVQLVGLYDPNRAERLRKSGVL